MHSNWVGLGAEILAWVFIYGETGPLCSAGSSEPWLLANSLSTKNLWTGSFIFFKKWLTIRSLQLIFVLIILPLDLLSYLLGKLVIIFDRTLHNSALTFQLRVFCAETCTPFTQGDLVLKLVHLLPKGILCWNLYTFTQGDLVLKLVHLYPRGSCVETCTPFIQGDLVLKLVHLYPRGSCVETCTPFIQGDLVLKLAHLLPKGILCWNLYTFYPRGSCVETCTPLPKGILCWNLYTFSPKVFGPLTEYYYPDQLSDQILSLHNAIPK